MEGYPVAMSPLPTQWHQDITLNLSIHLRELLSDCAHCKVQLPVNLKLDDATLLHPDLLVKCNDDSKGVYVTTIPRMVFEIISPGSRHYDTKVKPKLYAKFGIPYYVLIDPEAKTVEVFVLIEGQYRKEQSGETFQMPFQLEDCEIVMDFSETWSS